MSAPRREARDLHVTIPIAIIQRTMTINIITFDTENFADTLRICQLQEPYVGNAQNFVIAT